MKTFAVVAVCLIAAAGGGCKKKTPATAAAGSATPAEPAAPPVDPRNTNFKAGAGAVTNVKNAVKRTVTLSEMHQLGIIMFAIELQNGKLPTPEETKADLAANPDAKSIRAAIDEGVIIFTGTRNKDGMWAYEVGADAAGGVIVRGPSGTAERATAAEVKAYLAQK